LAECVLGAVGRRAECDIADQINELAEPLLAETRASIVFRQQTFQRWVIALDGAHGIVDKLPIVGCGAIDFR
jgi:hypothetical protein